VSHNPEPPGCRSAIIASGILVGLGLVFLAVGLALIDNESCTGSCESLALTLLYGGLPISAVLGVLFGELVLAWPLDVTFWVVVGFLLARFSDNRQRNVLAMVLITIVVALGYGLVLSSLVELAI
jgi:hypothetical protein